ncbi:MAG: exo-alpha-sialidase [Phycisphaeraceae bacterium]|nr:exo-alpha-sialidase [Phycisphaeraceae bacterium]
MSQSSRGSWTITAALGTMLPWWGGAAALAEEAPFFEVTRVVASGPNDKPNYRIPAIVQGFNGDLLVFAEKRNDGIGDVGNIDQVIFRSSDMGKTWQDEQLLFDDGNFTQTDMTVYADPQRDDIILLFLYDKKQYSMMRSGDSGRTWTRPVSIHDQIIPSEWDQLGGGTNTKPAEPAEGQTKKEQWEKDWRQRYGIGCGAAIVRLTEGPHAGRLLAPARAQVPDADGSRPYSHTFVIYSDDDGQTWHRGGMAMPWGNEAQLVTLPNGRLMVNARDADNSHRPDHIVRRVAISDDGGETWQPWDGQPLESPQCHGAIERYVHDGRDLLLFSNPKSAFRQTEHPYGRVNMSIRVSADEGKTWQVSRTIYPGPSSYSDIVVLRDGTIGVVYENGEQGGTHYWTNLDFARFNLAWAEAGPPAAQDKPIQPPGDLAPNQESSEK